MASVEKSGPRVIVGKIQPGLQIAGQPFAIEMSRPPVERVECKLIEAANRLAGLTQFAQDEHFQIPRADCRC